MHSTGHLAPVRASSTALHRLKQSRRSQRFDHYLTVFATRPVFAAVRWTTFCSTSPVIPSALAKRSYWTLRRAPAPKPASLVLLGTGLLGGVAFLPQVRSVTARSPRGFVCPSSEMDGRNSAAASSHAALGARQEVLDHSASNLRLAGSRC
jgi:hypothetical protein